MDRVIPALARYVRRRDRHAAALPRAARHAAPAPAALPAGYGTPPPGPVDPLPVPSGRHVAPGLPAQVHPARRDDPWGHR